MPEFYLEYEIKRNRPGLLGDVASLIGTFKLNILTVSSINKNHRGFLLKYKNEEQLEALRLALKGVEDLKTMIFQPPEELDRLALKHGRRVSRIAENPPILRFERHELDYLVDYLGDKLKDKQDMFIGFRGLPRIGKTETAIAACVHANKPWTLISSTLLRKVVRTSINPEIIDLGSVLIIDAITSFYRSFPEHIKFVKNILETPVPRIIEHPDVLIRETETKLEDFDLIVELHSPEEDEENEEEYLKGHGFYTFDIS